MNNVPDDFHDALQAMRDAAIAQQATHAALVEAAEANQRTGLAMVRAIDAMLRAREEHDDLRDTVHRLERLVMELVNRKNGGT